ncbi:MAG: 4Fe-4S binding protein [Syntrophomonadaceae bacterium]|jgi:Pyruvate/2-oxoacid:ferredoxin oxidoreductase delta subunit/coenzyme F420-reducing hydrogenase delta subunit|nr:4Fe-4S binding protein [Syntrophomonadaceae bacterium]
MGIYNDYQVNPAVLVWGNHTRARRLAQAISQQQPVIWAAPEKPDYPITEFPGRTIWGRDLAYLRGQVGRFTIGLGPTPMEELEVGQIILVPFPARPILDYPDETSTTGKNLVFILSELGRGTYAEALSQLSALAVTNRVTVITDDVQVNFFEGEALYTEARLRGVVFIRTDHPPVVTLKNSTPPVYEVQVFDPALGQEVLLTGDAVISPIPSSEAGGLPDCLNLSTTTDELLTHYPGLTHREGILVFPDREGVMTQKEEQLVIRAMASQVARLATGRIRTELYYQVEAERCALCLTCYRLCPHQAIEMVKDDTCKNLYREACHIDPLACRGCGLCYAECPARAITPLDQTERTSPGSVILACKNAVGAVAAQWPGPEKIRLFPCAGAIGLNDMLEAVKTGSDVYVIACFQAQCQHQHQNQRAAARCRLLNRWLARMGLPEKIKFIKLSAADRVETLAARMRDKK